MENTEFSLAYIKNAQQIIFKDFTEKSSENSKGQIVDIDELKTRAVQSIFVPQELLESEDNNDDLSLLSEEVQFAPIKTAQFQNADEFEGMSFEQAKTHFEKSFHPWVLKNNLQLLDNLFAYLKHLKNLYPNDRTAFFEELWHLLKNNLGARNLRIVYNHLIKAKKEHEKNRLSRVIVEGEKKPNPAESMELGEKLMKHYDGQFLNSWEINEYNERSGQIIILASINKSPILIMADTYGVTPLQKTLLKSLFDGLQL